MEEHCSLTFLYTKTPRFPLTTKLNVVPAADLMCPSITSFMNTSSVASKVTKKFAWEAPVNGNQQPSFTELVLSNPQMRGA